MKDVSPPRDTTKVGRSFELPKFFANYLYFLPFFLQKLSQIFCFCPCQHKKSLCIHSTDSSFLYLCGTLVHIYFFAINNIHTLLDWLFFHISTIKGVPINRILLRLFYS